MIEFRGTGIKPRRLGKAALELLVGGPVQARRRDVVGKRNASQVLPTVRSDDPGLAV